MLDREAAHRKLRYDVDDQVKGAVAQGRKHHIVV